MTTWQIFNIIIDILFVAYYMVRIEREEYKLLECVVSSILGRILAA